MAYLFKLSSRLIAERHLPTIASDAYGIGFFEETRIPATNTAGALQQFQTEIASLSFGRTHWARNFVCFSPLDCCLCLPGLYIKGQDWIWIFVVVVIFLHFFIDSAQ